MMRKLIKRILPYSMQNKAINFIAHVSDKGKAQNFYNLNRFSYAIEKKLIRPDTEVGQFTSIARGVHIAPGNHPTSFLSTSPFNYGPYSSHKGYCDEKLCQEMKKRDEGGKVIIGSDVWIGIDSIITNGVEIGDGAVVGSNAVVTRDVPPYAIVGGVPAKVIRYRFSKDIIEQLLETHWWDLPLNDIKKLDFTDVKKSLNALVEIRDNKKKIGNSCFLITSVVFPCKKSLNNNNDRSIFTAEERLRQTIETIESIRKYCQGADIIFIEGGEKDIAKDIENKVEKYIYVGNFPDIKKNVNSKYKGLGETAMTLKAFPFLERYDFTFKLSGRYRLNEKFTMDNFEQSRFNFKIYIPRVATHPHGEHSRLKGAHSTRLYGVPKHYYEEWRKALNRSKYGQRLGINIENTLTNSIKGDCFFYLHTLGVEGALGPSGEFLTE